MRRTAPRPLALALADVAEQLAPATALAAVQTVWPAAVGEAIAAQAQPVAERGGSVTVGCGSAVWAQELDLMSAELIERLNNALGRPAVKALRCTATGSR